MSEISFNTTKEEYVIILSIIRRVNKNCPDEIKEVIDDEFKQNLYMDLSATHCNGTPLDFTKLVNFDDANFFHDILGINANIDRSTGKLENCFLPRCSK
jgi:hypothetical protein